MRRFAMTQSILKKPGRLVVLTAVAAAAVSIRMLAADAVSTSQPTTAPASIHSAVVAPVSRAADVDQLIKELGSDDADARDAAQKKLVRIGSSATAALKKAAEENDDPEIRSRAAAALAQMKDSDSNGISLITLHVKDAPIADVLKTIGEQAHCTFVGVGTVVVPGRAVATLTLDADQKPFWEVMVDLANQANVYPMMDLSGKNSIRLLGGSRNFMLGSAHQIAGPYWVSIAGLFRTRSIDMQGPPVTNDQFTVRMTILAEPKLAVAQMSDFAVKEATDDAGNSLMPRANAFAPMLRGARQMNHTIETVLTYPENPGKKIAILRGEIKLMLAQDVQQYIVDDILGTPKVTNPLPACKISATVTRQGTDMFRVNLQCSREGLREDQWAAITNHANDMTLEDAEGHAMNLLQSTMEMQSTPAEISFKSTSIFSRNVLAMVAGNRQLSKTGDPTRLTWNVATSMKPAVIPVTFKDLPMP